MEPASAPAFRHGVAREQRRKKRDRCQQVEHERGKVILERDGARGGDVGDVVEGWQEKPAGFDVRKFLVGLDSGVEILAG